MKNESFADLFKKQNASLYYALLDWKDKNLENGNYAQVVGGDKALHTLNEKDMIRLVRTVVADTIELVHLSIHSEKITNP